jgi:hypothetical protein
MNNMSGAGETITYTQAIQGSQAAAGQAVTFRRKRFNGGHLLCYGFLQHGSLERMLPLQA